MGGDMTRRFALLIVCAVSIVLVQLGLGAQAPQPQKPGPEHQRLAYFVGTWTGDGEMKPGPFGPGGKMSSKDTCEWFEGGFVVVCRGDGKSPMGPIKNL